MRYKQTFWEQKECTHEEVLETSICDTGIEPYKNVEKVVRLEATWYRIRRVVCL
jgi:hypothetical protein